ncbi:translationally controlled tumor protein [Pelomyxa schiedti]|nr:translationally controlled tumor protein [Pelomyxa schiedti]
MRVFKDVISGDEIASDSFPLSEQTCCYILKGRMVVKESGDYGISSNAGDEEGDVADSLDSASEKVIDIVDAHRLVKAPFDKKSYMAYIKGYMGKIREHVHTNNPAREKPFMTEAAEFVKKILANFDDYTFYSGESCNPDAMYPILFWGDDGVTPMFYIFKDGIKEEKY